MTTLENRQPREKASLKLRIYLIRLGAHYIINFDGKKVFTEFLCGGTNMTHAERAVRLIQIATPEIIYMMLMDRRMKLLMMVEALNISHGSMVSI